MTMCMSRKLLTQFKKKVGTLYRILILTERNSSYMLAMFLFMQHEQNTVLGENMLIWLTQLLLFHSEESLGSILELHGAFLC